MKKILTWSPATFVLGLVSLLSLVSGIAWSQGQNFGSSTIINGAGSNPLGASLNVKAFPYSAVGDGIFFVDGVTNAGNKQVTSATATFRAGIVGYTITCYKTPLSGTNAAWTPVQTTVASFINASTITYAGANAGVQSGMFCSITNPADHAGIAQAFIDAKSTFNSANQNTSYQSPARTLYFPIGLYGVSSGFNNLITTGNENCVAFKGDGNTKSILIPEFTFTPTGQTGLFIHDQCSGASLQDFAVEFGSNPIVGQANGGAIQTGNAAYVSNVSIYDTCFKTAGANTFGFYVNGGSDVIYNHPKVISAGSCNAANGGMIWFGAQGDVYSPFFSNTNQNFFCVNTTDGSNGSGARIWGGVIDEGSISKWQACVDFWAIGTTWTGGNNCISIDATSIVWFFGGYCGTFGGNTGSGPTVAVGGQAYFTGMHVRGQNAANYCWNALGTIFDEGGNSCTVAGGATIYSAGSTPLQFPLQINATTQLGGRQVVSGTAPGSCTVTGNGTSTCALDTGSTDAAGTITITAAGTTTAVGLVAFNYSVTTGSNSTVCNANYQNGTGAWNIGAVPPIFVTNSTTAISFNINNNASNLTAASTYKVNYECYGK